MSRPLFAVAPGHRGWTRVPAAALARVIPVDADNWSAPLWVAGLLMAPLVVAGVIDPWVPIFLPVLVCTIIAMPIVFATGIRQPALLVSVLIVWFASHKVVVAAVAPLMSATGAAWTYNAKEAVYVALGGACLATAIWGYSRSWRPRQLRAGVAAVLGRFICADWLALALIVLVAIYFMGGVVLGANPRPAIVYARRFASLPALYLTGRLLLASPQQFWKALRTFVLVAVTVAAFGILEWFVLGDRFWTDVVHIGSLTNLLSDEGFGSPNARLVHGMPANWFSYLNGVPVRRLVSTFLEPTGLAMTLALATGIAAFAFPWPNTALRARLAVVFLLGVALLLTIGKAGYVLAFIIVCGVVFRTTRRTAFVAIFAIGVLVAAMLLLSPLFPLGDNVARHIRGLTSGILYLLHSPFGVGLGTTGFWGERPSVGSDSTVGVIASQIGFLGAGLWLAWLLGAAWSVLPMARCEGNVPRSNLRRVLASATAALAAVSIISNSTSGLLAGSFLALFTGWAIASFDAPIVAADPTGDR